MNWRDWLNEGDQYQSAMGIHHKKPSGFETIFQYSVSALALESFIMAILDYHKKLSHKHTFRDFVEALQTVIPLDPHLREHILQHEYVQRVCSFTNNSRNDTRPEQVTEFIDAVRKISVLAHKTCVP